MSRNKTWGDELTIRAVADAYNVNVHVITSENENWYEGNRVCLYTIDLICA